MRAKSPNRSNVRFHISLDFYHIFKEIVVFVKLIKLDEVEAMKKLHHISYNLYRVSELDSIISGLAINNICEVFFSLY